MKVKFVPSVNIKGCDKCCYQGGEYAIECLESYGGDNDKCKTGKDGYYVEDKEGVKDEV